MPARKRDPELVRVDKVVEMIDRDRATIFRWFRQKRLTRHYLHDYEAGVRRAAVDLQELRERMPGLLPPSEDRPDA